MIEKLLKPFADMHNIKAQRDKDRARKQAMQDEHAQIGDWKQNNWKSPSEEFEQCYADFSLKLALMCLLFAVVLGLLAEAFDRI